MATARWYQTNFTGEALREKLEYADTLDIILLVDDPEDQKELTEKLNWEVGDYDLKTGQVCINFRE